MTDLDCVTEALKLCGNLISCHSRDWSEQNSDAILWGVLCGWECEEDHTHDDVCGGSAALEQVADRFQWKPERVDQIKRLRASVAALAALPAPSPGRTTEDG